MKILALLLILIAVPAQAYNGTTVDGDGLKIGDEIHRLDGVDAPEEGQKCETGGSKKWPCGKAATDEMERLLSLGDVSCKVNGRDGYGRNISICNIGDLEINAHMVRNGFAWAFRKYSPRYIEQEEQAKTEGLGIWRADTERAWEFRERMWQIGAEKAPQGCPIKGNISRNGRIYHAPWSPWYKRTKINTKKGERWFCDEADAIAAGWRAPLWRQ